MITVRYIYSACAVISTPDLSILCDPWFTQGAYEGSWYQYPVVTNPIEVIGKVDLIYVSHIHPDHYDSSFLKSYLEKYPETKIIIADFEKNYLQRKINADKFVVEPITKLKIKDTELFITINDVEEGDVIDSALAVKYQNSSVVNMNDNLFCKSQLDEIVNFCQSKIDIALLPYTGAGPYPQTYFENEQDLLIKAESKKKQFFERYLALRNYLNPQMAIPFAGKYYLSGSLAKLNKFRGVADAVEVLAIDPKAIVLADGGRAQVNTLDFNPSETRVQPYDQVKLDEYLKSISNVEFDYIRDINIPLSSIRFNKLFEYARINADRNSKVDHDYLMVFDFGAEEKMAININSKNGFLKKFKEMDTDLPYSLIKIDYRYLFGLLTGVYHWNNAEVGSHFFTTRVPDKFSRNVQSWLNFFHI